MYYCIHQHDLQLPCFHCQPHSYIRMVHHLIETCLLLQMSREQCIRALAEHARIRPLVTLTVWRELQKENRDFFRSYLPYRRPFLNRYTQRVHRFARRNQYYE
ncbi:hypothetical protein M5689_019532 [Euphorbia peplus]|nr:hypothetical protein M5689_019532 [Euphorbia peplus]